MKVPTGLAFWAFTASPLALGCAPDSGVIDPTTRSNDLRPLHSSERYSAWSGPPTNLGPLINLPSPSTDQHPVLSKDGLTLYFASNRPENEADTRLDQNIWVARRACTDMSPTVCAWSKPVMLGIAVNSQFLDASPTLSRDEHQLFFASQRANGHCAVAPCDRDLWVSYRDNAHDDSPWQPAVNLGPPVNTNREEVAPSYFENDDSGLPQLFFNDGVVNAAGVLTLGNIYVSQLGSDGTWGNPIPVDEPAEDPADLDRINTTFSDQRPSVSHDGRELYFHSTRLTPAGEVGLAHLWVATRREVSDPWSTPVLVPAPISDELTIHPFIHSHGKTETLLFVRSGDIWMSERAKIKAAE